MRVQQYESVTIMENPQVPQCSQYVLRPVTTSHQPVCRLTKCQRNILGDGKPQPAASVLEAMCHGFTPMAVSATASNNVIL